MNKILLVSPHFDDAVLSAGQFMAERPDCVVLTVFGGFPDNSQEVHTSYDEKCGFKNAEDAVAERRRENERATALLKAHNIDLDFPDSQYGEENQIVEITDKIAQMVERGSYEAIYAPIGLGHPDHRMVTESVLSLDVDIPIVLWEDLPLRVIEPELVAKRLEELGIEYKPTRIINRKTSIADKMRALSAYTSQIGTGILDPYIMYVPERFYEYGKG